MCDLRKGNKNEPLTFFFSIDIGGYSLTSQKGEHSERDLSFLTEKKQGFHGWWRCETNIIQSPTTTPTQITNQTAEIIGGGDF